MNIEKAIEILDAVIPPPEHHTVDLDHLPIAQAWMCIKETLTAEPIKHGKWMIDKSGFLMCSKCGTLLDEDYKPSRFCPNCGAKMDK